MLNLNKGLVSAPWAFHWEIQAKIEGGPQGFQLLFQVKQTTQLHNFSLLESGDMAEGRRWQEGLVMGERFQ